MKLIFNVRSILTTVISCLAGLLIAFIIYILTMNKLLVETNYSLNIALKTSAEMNEVLLNTQTQLIEGKSLK